MKEMPLIGLGTFIGIEADHIADRKKRLNVTKENILNALKIGYRQFDLAESYGNLSAIGEALKIAFTPVTDGGLGLFRNDVWITMKANPPFSQDRINSFLTSLSLDSFDLFLIHHSTAGGIFDNEENLEKAWSDLAHHVETGQIKRIGVSNFYEPHLTRLLAICDRESLIKPYANEVELNLMSKNQHLVEYCQNQEIKLIAYSPLGYNLAAYLLENPKLVELAETIEATPAQTSLALLMTKGITVIPKSTQEAHLSENFASVQFIEAVKQQPVLVGAIEKEPDGDGVTETSIQSKKHGDSLQWDVSKRSYSSGI